MADKIIPYNLTEVSDGYVARCSTNDKVTAFGKTEDEAGNNLVSTVQEYLHLFPNEEEEIFNTPIKTVRV